MKKILGIVGSPRKNGNTHHMVTRILEGARENGAKTEIIFLGNYVIKECDGCHTCWKGKPCCKSDDMIGLYSKITASDAFVFGTPVYWFGPTALMKGFIDRFAYFNCTQNRPEIRGKQAVVAVPFEDRTYKAASLVVEIFEKSFQYLEMEMVGKVLVPGVYKRGEVRNKLSKMDECYKLGKKLARI